MISESSSEFRSWQFWACSCRGSKRRSSCTCSSGSEGHIGVGQDFDQGNLEGRKRQGPIEPIAAALPLSGHARMAIQKCGNQVGLVAIYVTGIFLAGEIAQDRFGNFGISIGRECPPQHGRGNRLIEQAQPAPHAFERRMHFAISLLQGNSLQACRDRDFASNGILQELLIEALHRGQDGQFPFRILYHIFTPADLSLRNAVNTGLD